MLNHQPFNESELIKWISERNQHIPLEDLAFLVQLPASYEDTMEESEYSDTEDFDFIF